MKSPDAVTLQATANSEKYASSLDLSFPFCTAVPKDVQAEPGPFGSFKLMKLLFRGEPSSTGGFLGQLSTAAAQGSELAFGAGDKTPFVSWYLLSGQSLSDCWVLGNA